MITIKFLGQALIALVVFSLPVYVSAKELVIDNFNSANMNVVTEGSVIGGINISNFSWHAVTSNNINSDGKYLRGTPQAHPTNTSGRGAFFIFLDDVEEGDVLSFYTRFPSEYNMKLGSGLGFDQRRADAPYYYLTFNKDLTQSYFETSDNSKTFAFCPEATATGVIARDVDNVVITHGPDALWEDGFVGYPLGVASANQNQRDWNRVASLCGKPRKYSDEDFGYLTRYSSLTSPTLYPAEVQLEGILTDEWTQINVQFRDGVLPDTVELSFVVGASSSDWLVIPDVDSLSDLNNVVFSNYTRITEGAPFGLKNLTPTPYIAIDTFGDNMNRSVDTMVRLGQIVSASDPRNTVVPFDIFRDHLPNPPPNTLSKTATSAPFSYVVQYSGGTYSDFNSYDVASMKLSYIYRHTLQLLRPLLLLVQRIRLFSIVRLAFGRSLILS